MGQGFPTKLEYSNNGLQCIGPSFVVNGLVSEFCPNNVTISFETARLIMRRSETSVRFPNGFPRLLGRCISCESQYELNQFFRKNGCEMADGQTHCDFRGCLKPIWSTSRYCWAHLHSYPSENWINPMVQEHLQAATTRKWQAGAEVQQAWSTFEAVVRGKLPPGALMFLDLEYDTTTRRVYEVGMCDAWGNKVVDCFTYLSDEEMKRTTVVSNHTYPPKFNLLNRKAAKKRQHFHGTMDVHQLVKHLQKVGVTPETVMIVWATNNWDLSTIREWFEAEGYSDVLPRDWKCVGMVRPFRANLGKLSDGTPFPLRLPILFPLFHGTRHELAGRNHHALVDAQQTRLMFWSFIALCKDLSAPDKPFQYKDDRGVRQKSLLDYFPRV
jgi:hypothetical protein